MIWKILMDTPGWVYILFCYLLYVGVQSTKQRILEIRRLFILPIILLIMSLHLFFNTVSIYPLTITVFCIALFTGMLFGLLQVFRLDIKVDKKKNLIQLPGNWSTLIIILAVFSCRYYFGYELAVNPTWAHQRTFEITMLIISGLFSGWFVGRLVGFLYRFTKGPYEDLR